MSVVQEPRRGASALDYCKLLTLTMTETCGHSGLAKEFKADTVVHCLLYSHLYF